MIDALKKNDKVLTTGGHVRHGQSIDANRDKVVFRVDDETGSEAVFTKASVARVLEADVGEVGGIGKDVARLRRPGRAAWHTRHSRSDGRTGHIDPLSDVD